MIRQAEQPTARYLARTQAEVAKFFGVSIKTVASWAQANMPGSAGAWPLDEIAQWLRASGPWRLRSHQEQGGNGDPLMAGPSEGSEGLERYRKARAAIAELDLAERRGELIRRDLLRAVMSRAAAPLRAAGEQLTRRFSEDARQILDEGLEEFQRNANEFLGGNETTDGGRA